MLCQNRWRASLLFMNFEGGTNTGAAIREVVTSGFNESSGLRPLSEGVPKVLIVLTDGQSYDSVTEPAGLARKILITILASILPITVMFAPSNTGTF